MSCCFFFSSLWGDVPSLFLPIYHSKAQPGGRYACGRACLSGAAALVQVLVTAPSKGGTWTLMYGLKIQFMGGNRRRKGTARILCPFRC